MSSQYRNGRRKRYLFSYGTLLPEHAPREIGFVRGRLYDLGDYPGAVLTRSGPLIRGLVFELPEDPQVLERLDQYEEFNRSRPKASLFVRKRRVVQLQDGRKIYCWIYAYNRPTGTASPLPTGEYSKGGIKLQASARR
jgi:gamma-glutamylcyclotransferase (GGCT)/AIG2-like uncharacterized protein YtfP